MHRIGVITYAGSTTLTLGNIFITNITKVYAI